MAEVRVMMRGGLGNQLFQYASGFRVALCLNARFVVDTRWIEKYLPHTDSLSASFLCGPSYLVGTKPPGR